MNTRVTGDKIQDNITGASVFTPTVYILFQPMTIGAILPAVET